MGDKQKNSTDLQKFINAFEPNKYKILRTGIEVRGVTDIHNGISVAKTLINKLKLKLTINHTADMTPYGGFEVLPQ